MPIVTLRFRLVAHRLFSLLLLSCLMAPLLAPLPVRAAPSVRIVYAKPGAPDGNSGNSWATARSLRNAMDQSVPGDEIWVAAGVHKPFPAQFFPFKLKTGVAVYGCFTGSETEREERNPATHVTVLSGDLDNNDTNKTATGVITSSDYISGSNSFVVVNADGTDNTTVLDGFTITGGNANAPGDCTDCGGGLKMVNGNATLANLIFSGNEAKTNGGGLYLDKSSPTLTNLIFTGNQGDFGGGMYLNNSSPSMTNVTFSANQALNGGGLYNSANSNPTLTGGAFTRNDAAQDGGGIYDETSSPTLINVVLNGNRAEVNGGGLYQKNGSIILTNVLFAANRALGSGGAISDFGGNGELMNVTAEGNYADGGGAIYLNTVAKFNLYNTILWNNTIEQLKTDLAQGVILYSLINLWC